MASSSNLLRLLPPLALLAAALLPFISCHNNNTDNAVWQCDDRVVTKNQSNPTYANKMISDLLKMAPENGLAYAAHTSDTYGLVWCRFDFSDQKRSATIVKAIKKIDEICSPEVVATRIVIEDFCYLRVDTFEFFRKLDVSFCRILLDKKQIAAEHQSAYWASVGGLMSELKRAILQNKERFARSKVRFDLENAEIYGMGECLRQIGRESCETCMEVAKKSVMERCDYGRSCEIFFGSCYLKYYTKTIKI